MESLPIEFKKRIVTAMEFHREKYDSASQQARVLNINPAQLSRIYNGDLESVISDKNWRLIASKLNVPEKEPDRIWEIAYTPTFKYVYGQLEICQNQSISAILCDSADIGKTFTAKVYSERHSNCYLIDCSQVKSKRAFVGKIAQEIGIGAKGTYNVMYENVVTCLNSISKPLIILDEVGDLDTKAFLEIKALWNATEQRCGWYMMGADALKRKIERGLEAERVGYQEILSRFGNRFQRVSPEAGVDQKRFKQHQFKMVAEKNAVDGSIPQLYSRLEGSLRRVYKESQKSKYKTESTVMAD